MGAAAGPGAIPDGTMGGRQEGAPLPDGDDHDEYDVSRERARELARDHERSAADRFRELQKLEGEPTDDTLEDLQAERRAELADDRPAGKRLLRQLVWLAVVLVAIVAVAFAAGLWFGRSDEPRAARTLLGDRVETRPEVTDGIADGPAPTSGDTDEEPTCGIRTGPVAPQRQVATIMAGGVVVQYQPSALAEEDVDELEDWAKGYASHLLVAPNPRLDAPVVVTAFRHRMDLQELDTDVLTAFATGYGDAQGPRSQCPITGTG